MLLSSLAVMTLLGQCQNVVEPNVLMRLVNIESSRDELAIGIVGIDSAYKPNSKLEALTYIKELDKSGFNFSVGLMQVNKKNFAAYGLDFDTAFDNCKNINAGANIYKECFDRAKVNFPDKTNEELLEDSASCYYSGNFTRGYEKEENKKFSYVEKFQNTISTNQSTKNKVIQTTQAVMQTNVSKKTESWDVFGDFSQ